MKYLELNREEASELVRHGHTQFLFPIKGNLLVNGGQDIKENYFTIDQWTEASYPRITTKPDPVGTAPSAVLWNFAGDGTHHSEPFRPPLDIQIGERIQIENKYNVPPTEVLVENISLIRDQQSQKWFWLIQLCKP